MPTRNAQAELVNRISSAIPARGFRSATVLCFVSPVLWAAKNATGSVQSKTWRLIVAVLGLFILLFTPHSPLQAQPVGTNRVLELDGKGSYVELPPNLFTNLTEGTVEAWVKWRSTSSYQRFFSFGETVNDMGVGGQGFGGPSDIHFFVNVQGDLGLIVVPGLLQLQQWSHLAAVSGPEGLKLYLNGTLVRTNDYRKSFSGISGKRNYLGRWNARSGGAVDPVTFDGQIDEFRVWKVARTEEQIRDTMFSRLAGNETDLVGLWNFETVENSVVKDLSPGRHDGKMLGNAKVVVEEPPASMRSEGNQRVLELNGKDRYVELPPNMLTNLDAITIEGWCRWRSFRASSRFFDVEFGEGRFSVHNRQLSHGLQFEEYQHDGRFRAAVLPALLTTNEWVHIATVLSKQVSRLYLNGSLIVSNLPPADDNYGSITNRSNYLGRSGVRERFSADEDFDGQMSEVRVWRGARTESQIRENMHKRLTGREESLAALWNFEDGTARDASTNGFHGKLMGNAAVVQAERPGAAGLLRPAVISGRVTDESGKPAPNTKVRMEQSGEEVASFEASADGSFRHVLLPNGRPYDIEAVSNDKDAWRLGVVLEGGQTATLNFTLRPGLKITGTVFALVTNTPLAGIVVQLLRVNPSQIGSALETDRPAGGTLSDDRGRYSFANLAPGAYRLRCHVPGGFVEATNRVLLADAEAGSVKPPEIDFRIAPLKKGTFRTFGFQDGLTSRQVRKLFVDPEGILWAATSGGVVRYDGHHFTTLTKSDGLAGNSVTSIHCDPDGVMWFGTTSGLSRYNAQSSGPKFTNCTTANGLLHNSIGPIVRDLHAVLWVGNGSWESGGLSRFDGNHWTHLTATNDFPITTVQAMAHESDGTLWVGGYGAGGTSLVRIRDTNITRFSRNDGFAENAWVAAIQTADHGNLWIGTDMGAMRYSGGKFSTVKIQSGLGVDSISSIHRDREGHFWFGGENGVARFDGTSFIMFTKDDGLAESRVGSIVQTEDRSLWFGHPSAGLTRYNPRAFHLLGEREGVLGGPFTPARIVEDGALLVGATDQGIYRFDMNGRLQTNHTAANGWRGGPVMEIAVGPGNVAWIAGVFGLGRLDGDRLTYFTDTNSLSPRELLVTPEGTLWYYANTRYLDNTVIPQPKRENEG